MYSQVAIDSCTCAFMCVLVFVCNDRFLIAYVANHASANVKCKAVSFHMINVMCDYNYPKMPARRDWNACIHAWVRVSVCTRV